MNEREIIALPPGWPTYRDHRGRRYSFHGGLDGAVAAVWIWAYNAKGRTIPARSLRFGLRTARLFHAALGQAIVDAECAFQAAQERAKART